MQPGTPNRVDDWITKTHRAWNQDFSGRRTTDSRHVLTTIGLKCDDGIIGSREFIVANNCVAGI